MNYLSVENLSKSYGVNILFEGISFGINQGQKVALVARNGSGKSSLLKIIAGLDTPDSGLVTIRKEVKTAYLGQEPDLNPDQQVTDAVFDSDHPQLKAIQHYESLLNQPEKADALQAAFEEMDRLKAWDYEVKVKEVLSRLRLDHLQQKIAQLSGGQKKRVALAKILMENPDFIIMDEPTNHLDIDMIEWLEDYLHKNQTSIFMVTHDRYFLERVCDEIVELHDGHLYRYKGNYSYFLEKKSERQENESANVLKAKNLMRKELEWMRRQPKARGTKSKARIDAFHELKKDASRKTREKALELDMKMTRLGGKILELRSLRKSYGDTKILDGFSYSFKKGESLGIVGKNGSGKSSFLKVITEREALEGGKIVKGETVKFGYYTQEGIQIDGDKRVIEVIKDIAEYIPVGRKGQKISASQMLERFLFDSHSQYTFVSKLSGGEKRRLYLLTVLMQNPNFLILDEPTNDLDILTLNVLEDFLMEFQGCLIIVTHDRYFMDKLTDHLFVFEGDGIIKDFIGNYTDYQQEKAKNKKEASEQTENKETTVKKPKAQGPKTRLTYNEKRELEQLEKDIEQLESRKAAITALFEKAESSAEELQTLSVEMKQLIDSLESKENRWLELSEFN